MYVSQKIKLDLTTEQKLIFENYFGQARFIYNRSVDVCKELFDKYCKLRNEGRKAKECGDLWPTIISLFKAVRAKYKEEQWDKEWDIKINKNIFETSMEDCSRAFEAKFGRNKNSYKSDYEYFLKYRSKKDGKHFFTFKNKGNGNKIFLFTKNRVSLPSFSGYYKENHFTKEVKWFDRYGTLKLKEPIREIFLKKLIAIKRATIHRYGSSYFIALQMELSSNPYKSFPKNPINKAIGIDLGVKDLIVGVDDEGNELSCNIPDLSKYDKKIKELQSILDHKRDYFSKHNPGKEYVESNTYKKVLILLQNTRLKRSNILDNFYNQLTKEIIKDYDVICMEELKSHFMFTNHNLASALYRKGIRLYEIKRILEYKSNLYNRTLVQVDKFFPSTQTCSLCGNIRKDKEKLKLSDRNYTCLNPFCYHHAHPIDRDFNAAKNILREGCRLAGYELI